MWLPYKCIILYYTVHRGFYLYIILSDYYYFLFRSDRLGSSQSRVYRHRTPFSICVFNALKIKQKNYILFFLQFLYSLFVSVYSLLGIHAYIRFYMDSKLFVCNENCANVAVVFSLLPRLSTHDETTTIRGIYNWTTRVVHRNWQLAEEKFLYIYPLSTNTSVILVFSPSPSHIYIYNKYRSYTTTWCTFNPMYIYIYILTWVYTYYKQNIFKLQFSTGAFKL